jgi:diaminopimelate decarboxylase/aspartate kinase
MSRKRVSRPWIVLKYGGTSVKTASRWEGIAAHARELLPEHRVWIVVSALSGTTDRLEGMIRDARNGAAAGPALAALAAEHRALAAAGAPGDDLLSEVEALWPTVDGWIEGIRLTGEAPPRLRARILASGELAASRLGAAILRQHGLPAAWADTSALLISEPRERDTEEGRFLDARVRVSRDPESADSLIGGAGLVVSPGFIARTRQGETCLLGRGGSDTSASLVAALLGAEALEIWTDVHGMFTANPEEIPTARLIRRIGYREAQELAAMGAKVLHPRCLVPAAETGFPVVIRCTQDPGAEGTRIEASGDEHPVVTAVTCRRGMTLITLSTLAMWETPGFLARAFSLFEDLGISVDLVATSQAAVTLTLDKVPEGVDGRPFAELLERLERLGAVRFLHPCAVVSIVGRRIRAALGEIGSAMEVFQERPVHLISDSAEDLNLSFVVDEQDAAPMVAKLHARLFPSEGGDPRLGPTWTVLGRGRPPAPAPRAWWHAKTEALVSLVADGRARYVYHLPTLRENARRLRRGLPSVDAFYYSVKANAHPAVLEAVAGEGFGLECVSLPEVERVREVLGDAVPVLFTPNFCPLDEYAAALAAGAEVVIDGPDVLDQGASLFAGAEVGLRVDPGFGKGHDTKVRTAGAHAKFGHPLELAGQVAAAAERHRVRVIGIHAHIGSGILDPLAWVQTGTALAAVLPDFPHVRWLDLGGGLGVPDRPGQPGLALDAVERSLGAFRAALGLPIRLEPGRYLVSDAGVLVAPVTQVRTKGGVHFAGLATGMNSLIRPALYGAWHTIHNLSRDGEPSRYWQIVGPICETADILGRDRWLPDPRPGDVLLVENAGAYGAVMGSRYNLREPAAEHILD